MRRNATAHMCVAALLVWSSAVALADAPRLPGPDTRRPGAPILPPVAAERQAQEAPAPAQPPDAAPPPDAAQRPTATPAQAEAPGQGPQAQHPIAQRSGKPLVALEIRCHGKDWGRIVLELDPEKAPRTVANFLRYVDEGFYDGTIFHRVIRDFIAQGGGYVPPQSKKEEGLHEPIPCESKNGLKNLKGTIAAARGKEPQSARAQFFINLSDNPQLDYPGHDGSGYAVFGRVIDGMDVVEKIDKTRTKTSTSAHEKWLKARREDPHAPPPVSSEPIFAPEIVRAYRITGDGMEPPAIAGRRRPTATQPPLQPDMPPPPETQPAAEPDEELEAQETLEEEQLEEPAEEPADAPAEPEPSEPSAPPPTNPS